MDKQATPRITVLGVHTHTGNRNEIDELLRREVESSEEFAFQWTEGGLAGYADEIWELRSNATLIEVLVENPDDRFSAGDFMQADQSLPRDKWQVAWLETYLSADGETLISDGHNSRIPVDLPFRVAFFIHYWKQDVPLHTSYGPLAYPEPTPQPERLQRLVPYSPPG